MTPPNIPTDGSAPLTLFLRSLVTWVQNELKGKTNSTRTNQSTFITSPNGTVYEITVADNGALTTTSVVE